MGNSEKWVLCTVLSSHLSSPSCLQSSVTRRHTLLTQVTITLEGKGRVFYWLRMINVFCQTLRLSTVLVGNKRFWQSLLDQMFPRVWGEVSEEWAWASLEMGSHICSTAQDQCVDGQLSGVQTHRHNGGHQREPIGRQYGRVKEDQTGHCPAWPETDPRDEAKFIESMC